MTRKAEIATDRLCNLSLAEVAVHFPTSPLREMCASAGRRAQAGDSWQGSTTGYLYGEDITRAIKGATKAGKMCPLPGSS
jgi:hypothetical protein